MKVAQPRQLGAGLTISRPPGGLRYELNEWKAALMRTLQKLPGRTARCHLFLLMIATALSFGCSTPHEQSGQNSPATTTSSQVTPPTTASTQPNNPSSATLPQLSDVQEAVKRVCVDAVAIDMSQSEPFIVGDFNGDGSEDLVVIVRPVRGALPKLNSEYANWIIEDPRKVVLPDPDRAVQRLPKPPPPVFVQANDVLLLVLHGYQQAGWHHQYARQTFLLRNAVGENIRARSFSEVSTANVNKNRPPQRAGDVISEKLTGREGFLYWTNGRYAWWE
jgi:hypothetical protein